MSASKQCLNASSAVHQQPPMWHGVVFSSTACVLAGTGHVGDHLECSKRERNFDSAHLLTRQLTCQDQMRTLESP